MRLLETLGASAFSVAMLAVVYWPLERAWPARRQPWLRRALGTDFLFLFGQHLVWSVLALGLLAWLDGFIHGAVPAPLRDAFLAQPRWVALVEIVLLGDLAVYWFHRASHAVPLLWRFHAVHHSSESLDWVAAHREHPIDGLLTQLTLNLPAMLLGFPVEGLAGLAVFRGLWAIFIHSNARLPLGPLRYLLGAPELHHWHHAREPGTVANYGNLSPWTDLLFGTFHLPPEGEETWALGVPEPMPASWPGLLVAPFRSSWGEARAWGLRLAGPGVLAALVAVTFGAITARAEPSDAGSPSGRDGGSHLSAIFGTGDARYLPATKSFGGTLGTPDGFGGLGLRGSGSGGGGLGFGGIGTRAGPGDAGEWTVGFGKGTVDRNAVRDVIHGHRAEVRRCADTALGKHQRIDGKVTVKFVISPTGAVKTASVVQTTVGNADLETCVTAAVATWTFPVPAGGGTVTVNYPFVFREAGADAG